MNDYLIRAIMKGVGTMDDYLIRAIIEALEAIAHELQVLNANLKQNGDDIK